MDTNSNNSQLNNLTQCTTECQIKSKASEVEITYLKLLNREVVDKNDVLKSNNSLLTQRIDRLESDLKSMTVPGVSDTTNQHPIQKSLLDGLLYEYQDRENRKNNFIVFNCPESTQDPKQVVIQVIEHCTQMPPSEFSDHIKVFRLGKVTPNKNRPLKVVCNSRDLSSKLLRNFKQLKTKASLKHLSVGDDKTQYQLEEYNRLKRVMADRIRAGESNLKIIYNNGIPKIISINKDNLN